MPVSSSGMYFDTLVTVTLYDYDGSSEKLLGDCMDICDHYESLFSTTKEGSDVWRINHAEELSANDTGITTNNDGSIGINVDKETADIINTSLEYCSLSGGALDLTAETLIQLWDIRDNISETTPVIPGKKEISQALSHTGYDLVSACYDTDKGIGYVTLKDPDVKITLGFIAKGYIADKLSEYLKENGVRSALINLGGNVLTIGTKPDGTKYNIGIQKPFADRGESVTTVRVSDSSVVSSGIYERYYKSEGHIYHHILDAKNGYPTDNGVYGVSVICDSSTSADALSTICILLGPDKGLSLIETLDDTEALYIMSDDSIITSSGWNTYSTGN